MTLEQKIAQKMMVAFRYWCDDSQPDCTTPMTEINPTIQEIISQDNIGGVILFANNLANTEQVTTLTWQLQQAVAQQERVGLFIGIDQEGGNVVRLPRTQATNFPGNMALAAATQANPTRLDLAYRQGQIQADEVHAVGFNVNFAPVVDVQSNPLNPVINVRAYSDDPTRVSALASQVAKGMANRNVIATFKHFPGHGDTQSDSHFGLPVVSRSAAEAYQIDLAPYQQAIRQGDAPDMIMSAHIQYPALDASLVTSSKTGESMITPATLSRKIIHEVLRQQLGYRGIVITDALDMQGISSFFQEQDAVIKAFQAGVDIALMPTEVRTSAQRQKLTDLIAGVAKAVRNGDLAEQEITESVERIMLTKLKRNLINQRGQGDLTSALRHATTTLGNSANKAVEQAITDASITLLKNEQSNAAPLLPMSAAEFGKTYLLTPWQEQYNGLSTALAAEGITVTGSTLAQSRWDSIKKSIEQSDTLVMATLSTGISPVEKDGVPILPKLAPQLARAEFNGNSGSLVFNSSETPPHPLARQARLTTNEEAQLTYNALRYARSLGKQTIALSLRAPYDAINYDDVSDVIIASYNYFGFENGWRSLTLPTITEIMLGKKAPQGKLPVNVYQLDEQGQLGNIRYPRGFGLSY
ncbi:beta-hexosaminidase [Aeromonas cavernicola]|uniref:beta-N-acetylhexosaminidase n=2 Tax=Aeromonas cavernicola TaxID=1006623 RepID=A0A2H9U0J7_9GAMM|nr:beta-hexosaminidase [Aeromonas cavernicola]